jgi:hypothetical protein
MADIVLKIEFASFGEACRDKFPNYNINVLQNLQVLDK